MAPANMTWSFDMRLLIDILFSDAALSHTQRSDAFNAIFETQTIGFGFVDGVPFPRLRAQYGEKTKKNRDWIRIRSSSLNNEEFQKRQTLQAQVVNIVSPGRSVAVLPSPARTAQDARSKKRVASYDETPLPLSKRPAVGLWAPETPQSSSVRAAAAAAGPIRSAKQTASKPKALKSPRALPDGSMIVISNDIKLRRMVPSISRHRAQPPLPKLLFRLWKEDASNRDSYEGFWSRRHFKKNALSSTPPQSSSIDATDILDHMNRTLVDTPFISTTNRLIWMVQQTITAIASRGEYNVSVINVDALNKDGVFWARPFHDEVRLAKPFKNGAGNYRGTHEFLVWQHVPEVAILHTFKATDLMTLVSNNGDISQVLRFDILRPRAAVALATKIANLRRQKVPLSRKSTVAIAALVSFFGLRSPYTSGHISAIVTGICEGWGLDIQSREERVWQQLANHFANQFGTGNLGLRERQTIKLAFLDGVAWGCGEPNAKHTPAGVASKERKAAAVGLASPSDILAHELDAMKLALKLHEKAEQRALQRYHHPHVQGRTLLDDDATEDGLGDDLDEAQMSGGDGTAPYTSAEDKEPASDGEEIIFVDDDSEDENSIADW